jgi:transposase
LKKIGSKQDETEGSREGDGLPVLRRNVAGIDLGSTTHWVCAPTVDGTAREVEQFGATTPELEKLAQWLKARKVESVAMESTGVYWIPPHELLERHGFEVVLVNTRQLAHVPGRKKTDRVDCQWIQRLHGCGLLRGSFRPSEQVCMLRTLVRQKATLVEERADWVRRMQKSLDQMNVRVHRAVSDINGTTGMAIIRAIVKGERDPAQLAKLRDPGCRKSAEEIAEQLSGHWREDHLFSLEQSLKMHAAIDERIQAYETEMQRQLAKIERVGCEGKQASPLKNKNKAKMIRQRGEEPMRQALYRMSGVDLTAIDAVGVGVVQVVLTEYGSDLSCFPTEKHFISHMTLAPKKASSGGKPLKKKKRGGASSRVSAALRSAALSLRHSQTALGAYFRHTAQRLGADVAAFATARKLGTLIYRLLRWGQAYVDEGAEAYEKRYQTARINRLLSTAAELGYELVANPKNRDLSTAHTS